MSWGHARRRTSMEKIAGYADVNGLHLYHEVQGEGLTVAHGELMTELIPGSALAVLPDTTHMQVTRRTDLLLPLLAAHLGR